MKLDSFLSKLINQGHRYYRVHNFPLGQGFSSLSVCGNLFQTEIFHGTHLCFWVGKLGQAIKKGNLDNKLFLFFLCFLAQQPPSGPGPPHSRGFYITQNDAPQSVGLLWTSDQLSAKTSTWQHTTLTTDRHPCLWWESNPQPQRANGGRPTL